jgi:hypothetical protein
LIQVGQHFIADIEQIRIAMGIETMIHRNEPLPIFVYSGLKILRVSRIQQRDFFIEMSESAGVFAQQDFHKLVDVLAQSGVEFVGGFVLRKRMRVPMV